MVYFHIQFKEIKPRISEILQFKSEHDANKQMLHEHDQMVAREKSESIVINRNQYSTGDESDDGFSFRIRNDDTNPVVKDEGFEFRYYNLLIMYLCVSRYKNN